MTNYVGSATAHADTQLVLSARRGLMASSGVLKSPATAPGTATLENIGREHVGMGIYSTLGPAKYWETGIRVSRDRTLLKNSTTFELYGSSAARIAYGADLRFTTPYFRITSSLDRRDEPLINWIESGIVEATPYRLLSASIGLEIPIYDLYGRKFVSAFNQRPQILQKVVVGAKSIRHLRISGSISGVTFSEGSGYEGSLALHLRLLSINFTTIGTYIHNEYKGRHGRQSNNEMIIGLQIPIIIPSKLSDSE